MSITIWKKFLRMPVILITIGAGIVQIEPATAKHIRMKIHMAFINIVIEEQ